MTAGTNRGNGPALLLLASAALLGVSNARAAVVDLERVSVSSTGVQANGNSLALDISADGQRIVFTSSADNLVPGDTNEVNDIFLHDRTTGETLRVSTTALDEQSPGNSSEPVISGDGKFVAFRCDTDKLIPGKPPGVFVKNLLTGAIEKVEQGPSGAFGSGIMPAISHDGRFVAFAAAFLPGETSPHATQVYVRDRLAGVTDRVSVGPNGSFAQSQCSEPSLSSDGRFVTFISYARNLVTGDTNGLPDVFLFDRQLRQTRRVDLGPQNTQGQGGMSETPTVSDDGRFVAFASSHTNLTPNDTNGLFDVFVRDLTSLVTRRIADVGADAGWIRPDLSPNGRFVTFIGPTDSLVPDDANGVADVFLADLPTGGLEIVSKTPGGAPSDDRSFYTRANADGSVIAFSSFGANLVPGDTNDSSDVFVAEVGNRAPAAVAGPDQALGIPHDGNSASSTVAVTLDGAGSSDPDGDTLSFQWKDSKGAVVANTATLRLDLPAGEHVFTLRVTDPAGAFSEDQVTVSVEAEPNGQPVAAAGMDRKVKAKKKTAAVRLDGRGSSDPDGDPLNFVWKEGTTVLATGPTPQVKLKKGRHVIVLTVTDPYGASDADEVILTVKKK